MDFFEQPRLLEVARHLMLVAGLVDMSATTFMAVVHFLRYTRSAITSLSLIYAIVPVFFHLLSASMALTVGLLAIDTRLIKAAGYTIFISLMADVLVVILRFTHRPVETEWFLTMADIGTCAWLGTSSVLLAAFLIVYRQTNWWYDDIVNALATAKESNVKANDVWRVPEVVGQTRAILAQLLDIQMKLTLVLMFMLVTGLNAHTFTGKLTMLSLLHLVIPFFIRAVVGPGSGRIPEPGVTNPRATVLVIARVMVVIAIMFDGASAVTRTYLLITGLENFEFGSAVFASLGTSLSVISASIGTSIVYLHLIIGAVEHLMLMRLRRSLLSHMHARYETVIKPAVLETQAQLLANERTNMIFRENVDDDNPDGEWKDKVL